MNVKARRSAMRVARTATLGALLALAVAPQPSIAKVSARAHYHQLADAVAKRSCTLWKPGSTLLDHDAGGRVAFDYAAYTMLAAQYNRFTQHHLVPSWAQARSQCNTPHSVSSVRNSFSDAAATAWSFHEQDRALDGLRRNAPGSPKHQVWMGYYKEAELLFDIGEYFASDHYVVIPGSPGRRGAAVFGG